MPKLMCPITLALAFLPLPFCMSDPTSKKAFLNRRNKKHKKLTFYKKLFSDNIFNFTLSLLPSTLDQKQQKNDKLKSLRHYATSQNHVTTTKQQNHKNPRRPKQPKNYPKTRISHQRHHTGGFGGFRGCVKSSTTVPVCGGSERLRRGRGRGRRDDGEGCRRSRDNYQPTDG